MDSYSTDYEPVSYEVYGKGVGEAEFKALDGSFAGASQMINVKLPPMNWLIVKARDAKNNTL